MLREWCPSGVADSAIFKTCSSSGHEVTQSSINRVTFCRENSAVAANMDKSAIQLASQISRLLKPWSSRFSMASVASRVNKSYWPQNSDCSVFEISKSFLPEDVLSNYNGAFWTPFVKVPCSITSISLPADQFLNFLVSLGHMDSFEKSDSAIQNLLFFPSFSRSISFEELYPYLKCHSHLISNAQLLFFSGLRFDSDNIVSFCSDLKHLTSVSIERCSLKDQVPELLNTLKDTFIEHLSLEGNDFGGVHDEIDDNEFFLSLSNLLKYNKFLRSLNLSYNNFTSEDIENIVTALYESDTILSPESIAPAEKDDTKVNEEDLLLPFSYLFPQVLNVESDSESLSFALEEQQDEEDLSSEDDIEMKDEGVEEEDEQEEEEEEGEEGDNSQISEDGDSLEDSDGVSNQRKATEKLAYMKKKIVHEQRLFFAQEESGRQQIIIDYSNSLRQFLDELRRLYAILETEKQQKIEAYCKLRSGWSRLNCLNLRGNNFGDRGARAIKRILKDEITLLDEEMDSIQDKLKEKFLASLQDLQKSRKSTLVSEFAERRHLMNEFTRLKSALLLPPLAEKTDEEVKMNDDNDNNDNNALEVVMLNAEDTLSNEESRDLEMLEDELAEDFDWEMEVSNITIPVLPTKSGMNSIKFLDVSSCGISSNGLKAIASSLVHNKVLTTLILRNNAIDRPPRRSAQFATNAEIQNASTTEGCDSLVGSGFMAFVDMLRINQSLTNIDLGYCQLQRESIIHLACVIRENKVLSALNLEGNPQGFSRRVGARENSLLTLLCSIEQSGSLDILNLSNNDLDDSLWGEEICALANVITRLTSLHLRNVGLNGDHLMRLVAAIGSRSCALRVLDLARNHFRSEDGPHIGSFMNLCKDITKLNLDGNTKLDSTSLFSVLVPLSTSNLSWLSCNGTALNTASAIPSLVVQHLNYLSLSDIEMEDTENLATWVALLAEHGKSIRFLSLWSRHLDMQLSLDLLKEMVKAMHSLLYGDFGVLFRFDTKIDECHALGEMENVFSSRRAELMSTKV
ncbi:unnamed protein product [Phytomonas sp. EM1]|nr:unnamed protein product [Phytomonas sp. EM1]|eukprot:CCW62715.1 unnamed protein product [Phytomonas sp. isolate EM1]